MAGSPQHEALRSLPQVEELLRDARLQQIAAILERYPGVMLGAELKRR